jgi:phosphatidylglycerophosphate synthase
MPGLGNLPTPLACFLFASLLNGEPVFDPVLRPVKDRAFNPIARMMPAVDPVVITAAALLVGLGAAGAAWAGAFRLGLVLWLVNRILDALDGAVARLHGKATDLGGYLDLVGDFVIYGAIPASLALRPGAPDSLPGAAIFLLVAFYVNTAAWMVPSAILEKRGRGAGARGEPTSVTIPEALISGGETVVLFSLFFLLPPYQTPLFLVMAGLTGITAVQRVIWGIREFGGQSSQAPQTNETRNDS